MLDIRVVSNVDGGAIKFLRARQGNYKPVTIILLVSFLFLLGLRRSASTYHISIIKRHFLLDVWYFFFLFNVHPLFQLHHSYVKCFPRILLCTYPKLNIITSPTFVRLCFTRFNNKGRTYSKTKYVGIGFFRVAFSKIRFANFIIKYKKIQSYR